MNRRRLDRIQLTSDSTRSLIGTSIGHFLNDGANSLFPVVYPVLLQSYHVSIEFIGVLAALYSLSSLVSSPFIGRRSDYNWSYPRLIPIGLVTVALGILGFSFTMVFFSGNILDIGLVAFTLLAGFGSSFYHPIAAAILNETWSLESRGRAMGINGSMGGAGTLAFPIITVGLIVLYGIASLTLIVIAFFLLSVIIYSIMRRMSVTRNRVTNGAGENLGDQGEKNNKKSGAVPLRIVLSAIATLTLAGFFRSLLTQGVIWFLPTYLTSVSKINYQFVGTALIPYSAAAMIGQPLFGSLADRYGRRAMVALTTACCVLSVLSLSFSSTNFLLTELSLFAFGLFSYTSFPLFLGLSGLIAPKGSVTQANSIVWGFGMIGGGAVGPAIIGALSGSDLLGSLNLAFLVAAGIGSVSLAFLPLVPNARKNVNLGR